MAPHPVRDRARPEPARGDAGGAPLSLELARSIAPLLAARVAGLGEHAPADLSAGNLWLFRRAHDWRWHEGPWPCLSGLAYDGQAHALPLFDIRRAPVRVLHDLLARHRCLFPLGDREVEGIDRRCFALASNRNDSDYLYTGAQFRQYRGRALQKKANLMAQLLDAHRVTAQPYAPMLQQEALAILDGWLRDKDKTAGDADDPACREALALAPELRLEGFLYRADGEPAGFLLAEELQPGVWVVRFAKGLVRFKGIAQYMFHHFAARADRAVEWLNFEQDLGLPNFRHTKLSYRPAALLHKWRLLPASS